MANAAEDESRPFGQVNHVGFVVKDLREAEAFFVNVLEFSALPRTGHLLDADGDLMTRRFGVDVRAVAEYAFFDGGSIAIELLQWTATGASDISPLNCDLGGRHLALSVNDMDAAFERLSAVPGIEIRQPNDMGFIYVRTPFGLEIQLIPVAN